ncbi:DUF924 family protein [Advenella sp. RU8]|uniref:DUF924 family protein n=1 Tax=Advenella sp. RU8 TaxID=3399575 RepID=UPI003AAA3F22
MERKFIIMPCMHSESKLVHEKALLLFTELDYEYTLDFEISHKDQIDRFSCYLTRNHILGRQSTEEEQAFLQRQALGYM